MRKRMYVVRLRGNAAGRSVYPGVSFLSEGSSVSAGICAGRDLHGGRGPGNGASREAALQLECGCQDEQNAVGAFLKPEQIAWLDDGELFSLLSGLSCDLEQVFTSFSHTAYDVHLDPVVVRRFFLEDYMQCRILIAELNSYFQKL